MGKKTQTKGNGPSKRQRRWRKLKTQSQWQRYFHVKLFVATDGTDGKDVRRAVVHLYYKDLKTLHRILNRYSDMRGIFCRAVHDQEDFLPSQIGLCYGSTPRPVASTQIPRSQRAYIDNGSLWMISPTEKHMKARQDHPY